MEALLALGEAGVEPIIRFLGEDGAASGGDKDLLWPLVVLGEMRDPRAVPTLLALLGRTADGELSVAAAEALAKLGRPAVAPLRRLLDGDAAPETRILAYGALAGMDLPEAWEILAEALEADPEVDFAVARCLAERNLPDDVTRVHRVYCTAEPWKRPALEATLAGMLSGQPAWPVARRDWRLRYRREPRQDLRIPVAWLEVMLLTWQSRRDIPAAGGHPARTLEDLRRRETSDPRDHNACPDCGEPFRSPTGIRLCSEVEEDLIAFQLERVRGWVRDRWEDIHEVLDELDHQEMEALQWPEADDQGRAQKMEALDSIELLKDTLCWMVEEGLDGLSKGEGRLWTALQRARSRKRA
jgi:hypothetical protein